jgi:hypothetical protein
MSALAVPEVTSSGAPFPDRDLIVFVTAGVIVVTLVLQGLALPGVLRWARLPRDTSVEQERHLAETLATEEALAAIPQIVAGLGTDPDITSRVRREYEKHLRVLHATTTAPTTSRRCGTTSSTPRCARPSWRTNAPPWSGCATNAASTTPCCARSRGGSTSKRSGCPAPRWPTDQARGLPG